MERKYNTTKEKMLFSSYRQSRRDADLVTAACKACGISRSAFLRAALKKEALRVIRESSEVDG